MKTIYLFRHSIPEKGSQTDSSMIPLTESGKLALSEFLGRVHLEESVRVFSSPYRRAYESAQIIGNDIICDQRLAERLTGRKGSFGKDIWEQQYTDCDIAGDGGESFREVRARMTSAINDILDVMSDEETAVVVSHAAAICAFLQQWCEIEVTDATLKHRRITFENEIILEGAIQTPSCFVLKFDNRLVSITYIC